MQVTIIFTDAIPAVGPEGVDWGAEPLGTASYVLVIVWVIVWLLRFKACARLQLQIDRLGLFSTGARALSAIVGVGDRAILTRMKRSLACSFFLWTFLGIFAPANAEPLANWTANYPSCGRHAELLKRGPMNLGVRLATSNPMLAQQFKSALDFWATVLDLNWHEDSSENCSIELVDGQRDLFEPEPENMAARSQFPDRRGFQGWIVFNPAVPLNRTELYRISVHEIGHMLGLRHNPNALSLMYGLDLDCSQSLDALDLATLAAHHKLRITSLTQPIKLTKLP